MSANAIETLREALSYNPHGPEVPLPGEAKALAKLEALLQAAEDACVRNPAHLGSLATAVRRVKGES